MTSQRNLETKDRTRAENDHRVNQEVDLDICQLPEKMDHQLAKQCINLAGMQRIRNEPLEERLNERR